MDIDGQFLSNCIASLGTTWNTPTIVSRVEIQFSDRMRSCLGRCLPSRGIVRLNRRLLRVEPALVEEVICHEVAHVVAFERHGRRCRPHGPEWAALMRSAGFQPHVRARLGPELQLLLLAPRKVRNVYEHRCPICRIMRVARRPVSRWRCVACATAGRTGRLTITKHAVSPQ